MARRSKGEGSQLDPLVRQGDGDERATARRAHRIAVVVIGSSLVGLGAAVWIGAARVGLALLVGGMAILASELAWAHGLLARTNLPPPPVTSDSRLRHRRRSRGRGRPNATGPDRRRRSSRQHGRAKR
jgi:hypothetical protein